MPTDWKKTACILCSINCGVEIELQGRRLARVRGDKDNPRSRGYTCEKALRLDQYQNGRDRLTTPLRRRAGGGFEPIDWDSAIGEIAHALVRIRNAYGGASIFYYGGGGQGNHLGGAYASATRRALGSTYTSNALAQEKTGEFWVDGQLYGRPRCHTTGDFEHAEVAMFIGKNPWQSHGFPRARAVLREIARDPRRTLIVVDPRRSETAEIADIHLPVRPGADVFLLGALLAVLLEEDLVDHAFLAEHTRNSDALFTRLRALPVGNYCARAGIAEERVRTVARRIAGASSVSVYEDLGIQQAPHSTLNSYLEKLLYLLTGNFACRGGMNIHTRMAGLGGGKEGGRASPVKGHRIITGLIPCNVIPDEILTEHPARFRAMIVESTNPVHSVADSVRMRAALAALELVVVIDVAMTETARQAHYVLPAASQYEKWEATFFTLDFPENVFHLRAPLLPPLPGTLGEPEIHRRLVRTIGALRDDDLAPLHAAAAQGRAAYGARFLQVMAERPDLRGLAPVVLYETLGPMMGAGREAAAVLWAAAHTCAMTYPEAVRRAGYAGDGPMPGEALFEAILNSPSGVIFTVDEYADTWRRLATPDGRINLWVPELLDEFDRLDETTHMTSPEFPFVLSAGERRSSTANTIVRDPAFRGRGSIALHMSPDDASRLGIAAGARVRVVTVRGSAETRVEISDALQAGHITLPNGLGLECPDEHGDIALHGTPPNELTSSEHRDPLAGTPWHKHVPARVEVAGG